MQIGRVQDFPGWVARSIENKANLAQLGKTIGRKKTSLFSIELNSVNISWLQNKCSLNEGRSILDIFYLQGIFQPFSSELVRGGKVKIFQFH